MLSHTSYSYLCSCLHEIDLGPLQRQIIRNENRLANFPIVEQGVILWRLVKSNSVGDELAEEVLIRLENFRCERYELSDITPAEL